MNGQGEQPTFRLRKTYRKGDTPKKYQGTFEMVDDGTQEVQASCDLIGKAVFAHLDIIDAAGRTWKMRPNRKLMPSRWIVTDPAQGVVLQIDQKILGKMINPLYKVAFTVLDAAEKELFRVVDPRSSVPDRIFGLGPSEWAVFRDERLMGKVVQLPNTREKATGLLGKLRDMFTGWDRGLVSMGPEHFLLAPEALAVMLIFEELTDTSAA